MRLKKMKICNYRSFSEEKTIEFNELTTFIGNNSSGKTTTLSALQKLFGTTAAERNLTRSDFHLDKDEKADEIETKDLYIETIFEFSELEEGGNSNAITIMFKQLTIDDEGEKPYLRIRLEATWNRGTTVEGSIDTRIYYVKQSEKEDTIEESNKTTVKNKELQEGGSTITQQVAKNVIFSQDKSWVRKVGEIFASYDLEKNYSKKEIFELYVNTAYFGDGYYGIYDASYGYYNKSPKDLNLDEASMLAGVPNAPSVYAPTVNPNLAKKRQYHVLNKMNEYGYITKEEALSIK